MSDTVRWPAIRSLFDWALIGVFLAALFAPLCREVAVGANTVEVMSEFRTPLAKPALPVDWASFARWPEEYSAWYDDAFGFRSELLRLHNAFKVLGMGTSPDDVVLVGKDDWLFFTGQRTIENHRGLVRLDDAHLRAWQDEWESRRSVAESVGAGFLVVIAPDKESVYRERLPDRLTQVRPDTALDQLLAWMGQRSTVPILDLRPPLIAAKERDLVYFPLGTHWNSFGAIVGYRAILGEVARSIPAVAPHDEAAFELVRKIGVYDSWAERLRIDDLLQQPVFDMQRKGGWGWSKVGSGRPGPRDMVTASDDGSKPRLVMYHDSFCQALQPLLSAHFSRAIYVWSYDFDAELVRRERPDLVICEYVERVLVQRPEPAVVAHETRFDAELLGTYDNPRLGEIRLEASPDRPICRIAGIAARLVPVGLDRWRAEADGLNAWTLEFVREADGAADRVAAIDAAGRRFDLVRRRGDGPFVDRFAGTYVAFERVLHVHFNGAAWYLFDDRGELVAPLVEDGAPWRFRLLGRRSSAVEFDRAATGEVDGFDFTTPAGRAKAVRIGR